METEIRILNKPHDEQLQRWFAPLLEHGSTFAGPNLDTQLAFLHTARGELPMTVNEAEWGNSYTLSPWTHYITYGAQETTLLPSKLLQTLAVGLLAGLGKWLRRAEFNRVVMVNNWLLSTNPWPAWPIGLVPESIATLVKSYPDHAIIFRSLNEIESAGLIHELRSAGARLIPSRQVWYYPADSALVKRSRVYRQDLRLLHDDAFIWKRNDQLTAADFPRLAQLYHQLYVEKYSACNPQFSAAWLQHLWQQELMEFTALADDKGTLVGVEGACLLNGVLTSPIIGYDTALPRELGLYRRLAVLPIKAARERHLPLNLSAGVGHYKGLRGGEPVMEYMAVYDQHLPARRRWPWAVIEAISTYGMAPLVKRLRL